jgi:RES domain-containing protein
MTRDVLAKRLARLPPVSLRGHFFRLVPSIHAEAIGETGPSFTVGGRYNPRGEFGAFYLSQSTELCWKETLKRFNNVPEDIPPQSSGEFQVSITKCLDLTDEETRKVLGVDLEDITQVADHYLTQMIGAAAWSLGIEAVKFPSSVSPDQFNIAVFTDHLGKESHINRVKVSSFTSAKRS